MTLRTELHVIPHFFTHRFSYATIVQKNFESNHFFHTSVDGQQPFDQFVKGETRFYSWRILRYIFRKLLTDCFKFLRNHRSLFAPKTRSVRSATQFAAVGSANKFSSQKTKSNTESETHVIPVASISVRYASLVSTMTFDPAAIALVGRVRWPALLFRKPGNNQINAIHEFPMRRT